MKTFFLVVALAAFVCVQALTDEQKEKVKNYGKQCIESTGVDKAVVKKMREGDFTIEDDKLKAFTFCMFKKTGVMSEEGQLQKDVVVAKIEEDQREDVARAIDACSKRVGDSNEEVAWNYAKCYHKERPGHAVV